ncbi:MAG: hypothetical protein ACFFCV_06600 [Promethearchaeota archaeon]
MKKLELKDKINTSLPRNEIYQRIMDFANQNHIKIKEMNKNIIRGMYGSRLKAQTRGFRVEPSVLPVKITITLQDKENCTELFVIMKKGVIGIPPFGVDKKYLTILARLMNKLKLQFHREMYLKQEVSKCSNCGKVILYENQRYCEICGYELVEKRNQMNSLS